MSYSLTGAVTEVEDFEETVTLTVVETTYSCCIKSAFCKCQLSHSSRGETWIAQVHQVVK